MAGFDPAIFIENLAWMKPELLLVGFGLLLLLASAVMPQSVRSIGAWLTLAVLAVAAFLVTAQLSAGPGGVVASTGAFPDAAGHPAFVVDGFSMVFKLIFLLGGAFTVLMSMRYPETDGSDTGEFLALVVFSVFGMMFLASGTGLITIYIGLETMALAGYLLVGFRVKERRANEGAVKYFVLGALSSGILLYGISLIYGSTGSINLFGICLLYTSDAADDYFWV